jgi:hypothetical protein
LFKKNITQALGWFEQHVAALDCLELLAAGGGSHNHTCCSTGWFVFVVRTKATRDDYDLAENIAPSRCNLSDDHDGRIA